MHADHQLQRTDLDQLPGLAVIEFGADWCGYCQAAQTLITTALAAFPDVRHIRIEDGKGQLLGRSYAIRLWPTLVFLKDGIEISRLVRPSGIGMITDVLRQMNAAEIETGGY